MLNRKAKRLNKEQALQKLKHYCGYQERTHQEARDKLYSFGLYKQEVEELLARLIEEDYLNEERFALAYAGGKFKMKGWGKIKIIQALKEKRISEYCIKKAMEEIDKTHYQSTLNKFAIAKWSSLKSETNVFIKMRKTQDHLLQKGFEPNLVYSVLKQLNDDGFDKSN
ncbi:MAG TPA: regulatory protein RecX [Chitinophagaceae bacterium]|nr:regulatory protein RecX [Chitinophagaceae bacterium]